MDLTADQFRLITKFVQDWSKDKKYELETTFGVGGVVSSNTFLQIAQRARTKGFEVIPQEDRLSIITPKHIRFSLQGLGVIQSYCKDNSLENRQFSAMFKDRAFAESNVDLQEYDIRFKMRREEDLDVNDPRVVAMTKAWHTEQKAFRLIRRWSFQKNGVRIDMSIVRQTPTVPGKGGYQWSTTFLQHNILKEVPRYEVEVELLHGTEFTDTAEKALKALIGGVGEVQRAIQKNSLLIRNSVSAQVRTEYQVMTGSEKFRGVGPVTLQLKNMIEEADEAIPNIRSGYNVTDKADGLRAMGFVDKTGELFLIDQSMNVYRTGLKNEKCAMSLVDGEWVTLSKDGKAINHYLIFDIYYDIDSKKVSNLPFVIHTDGELSEDEYRYRSLILWNTLWNDGLEYLIPQVNALTVILKVFEFASPNNNSIFTKCCASILDTSRIYYTDGLIITSNSQPIPDKAGVRFPQQFKWKPAKDNTVDFLITYERDDAISTIDKISTSIDEGNENTIQYKTMRLYVGGAKGDEYENPRATILREEPIVKDKDKTIKYKPILFTPIDFPDTMANTCNVKIERDRETLEEYVITEDSKEPIPNRSVVEMRYDPSREPGWRWIPSRIRHDKTERLIRAAAKPGTIKYSGIMNDEGVANDVWNSIHEPITQSMIRTGNTQPTEEEVKDIIKLRESDIGKKYYERKAPKENLALVRGLQDFHNKYIKNEILIKSSLFGGNKRLVDVACGKAGDLYKWKYNGAKYVVGIDTAGENITNISDGAYKRYLQLMQDLGQRNVPNVAFAIGNSSKNIVSGEAGANKEERDILRSIFGRMQPEGPIPTFIKNKMQGTFRDGADVAACMFALHYFFENKQVLDGFLTNLSEIVKPGGYFIGCCFDGDKVFNLLRTTDKGHAKSGIEGDVPIWTITKEYDNEELIPDDSSIGMGINVEFISIGSAHKEYLVPFELLRSKMASIGFRLLNPNDLYTMNLKHSTNTFDKSFEMAKQNGKKYSMIPSVQEFSFLNRWFIFKRYGASIEDEKEEVAQVAEVAEAVQAVQADSNARFSRDVTDKYPKYAKFTVVPSSSYSVLKPWQEPQVTAILQEWFHDRSTVSRIVDATAHIGVDSIHLSDVFSSAQVHSYEIVPTIYNALVKNIAAFNKQGIVHPHLQDITTWQPDEPIDLLYVDPPWGGTDYKKIKQLKLYLQEEGAAPNETKNINNLIDKWINSTNVHYIILKAPGNFDKRYLLNKYSVKERVVLNQARKLAYTLILISSSVFGTEVESADSDTTAAKAAADAASVASAASAQQGGLEEKADAVILKGHEIFRFGPKAIDNTTIDVKDASGKIDKYAGRYLSPSMHLPIPIPDKNNKDITYPTIDHYMAGMRLKLSSPELAISIMSTKGEIHQNALLALESHKLQESDRYYDILSDENKSVKKYKHKTKEEDSVWIREKDEHLLYALTHRWKTDGHFKDIVNAAKKQGKYLLYHIEGTTAASEYSGSRTQQGHIKGENKMGKFIMKIGQM